MERLAKIFKIKDVRNKVFFILAVLIIFRIASAIPIPSVDTLRLKEFFESNQLFALISVFTGGGLSSLSIVMLGLGPYITASIIMQLLTMIFPSLEEIYKYSGEAGKAKFNQYSRLLTVPLAMLQGYGFMLLLSRQGVLLPLTAVQWASSLIIVAAGAVFLMWLGELITEKNLGNGISILIFAGIVAGFPSSLRQAVAVFDYSQLFTYASFVAIALIVVAGVVYLTESQRKIPVNYAKRVRGFKMYGGVSTFLPMRVNNAGVMPIIFALSILLFPGMIANFFAASNVKTISNVANFINGFIQNQTFYNTAYFILVVAFTYFYTAVTFDPKSISENLQKQGGYIPGIRPGPATTQFLNHLLTRITMVGAVFLGAIAILPAIVRGFTGVTAFTVGGTSILIVVSVVLEIMKQIDAQISMYEY